jgi:hypothetical protein
MAHIPDDFVARRLEGSAEGDGQLDDAQSRADVTACLRDHVDEPLPHFVRELSELLRRERLNVFGTMDRFENQFGLVTM